MLSKFTKTALALAVAVPTLKTANAIFPLVADGSGQLFDIEYEPSQAPLWVFSTASDRLIRDVYTAVMVALDYSRMPDDSRDSWQAAHTSGAKRLLKLCQTNKGIYIKFGQHIAQLDHLLPAPYVQTLQCMLAQAPVDSWPEVERILTADLGDWRAEFESISEKPIASASLAQVHTGVLRKTGQKVAVKVQHAGLRETCVADIKTIEFLVKTLKSIFPKFDYQWLVDETKLNLPRELDFLQEASNLEQCGANFRNHPRIAVPTLYRDATSHRVLTMSFEEGCYINDTDALDARGLDRHTVSRLLSEAFCQQIFIDGFVHCDPHSGNVLVRPSPLGGVELVLLDHGLYRRLEPRFRLEYARLWKALIFADEDGIKSSTELLGAGSMYQLFAAMLTTRPWDQVMDDSKTFDRLDIPVSDEERERTQGYATQYADDINDILKQVDREMLLLLKTNDCLRAVDRALGCPTNTLSVTAEYCIKALHEHESKTDPSWSGAWHRWLERWRLAGLVAVFSWYNKS